jgi:hypothetical protein
MEDITMSQKAYVTTIKTLETSKDLINYLLNKEGIEIYLNGDEMDALKTQVDIISRQKTLIQKEQQLNERIKNIKTTP